MTHPGTIWKTTDPAAQEGILAVQLHRLLEQLAEHEVPTYCLGFPRFARDGNHLFRVLRPIFERHGVSQDTVLTVHRKLANPSLIHDFPQPASPEKTEI